MARVRISKFAGRLGKTIRCSKCGVEIAKGQSYRWFSPYFRSRSKVIRCMKSECTPKQSETTSSKMSGVYAAIEDAEANLDGLSNSGPEDGTDSITNELQTAAEAIRKVAQEYRDAAEASPTGMVFGEDLNERADAIEGGADEIENWSADEDEPDFDTCENPAHDEEDEDGNEQTPLERGDESCDDCADIKANWWGEQIDSARSALSDATFD